VLHAAGITGDGIIPFFRHGLAMSGPSVFWPISTLTAVLLAVSLSGCGTGRAAIKAAEEKEAAELQATGGRVSSAAGLRLGYACCNLRYSGDWISDQSSGELPFIPLGTRVLVRSVEGDRAEIEAGEKPYRMGLDYGRKLEKTAEWVDKLVVLQDPTEKLAKYPANIRTAIEAGRLLNGMTREQVLMAVGYPTTYDTPKLDATPWKMYWNRTQYLIHWSGGKVSRIEAAPDLLAKILAAGAPQPAAAKQDGDKHGKSAKQPSGKSAK